jgi:hypothetical protein
MRGSFPQCLLGYRRRRRPAGERVDERVVGNRATITSAEGEDSSAS